MFVCACHTCYNWTKTLNFKVFRLKDFWRTLNFMVYKIFASRCPQVFETCYILLHLIVELHSACLHLWGFTSSNYDIVEWSLTVWRLWWTRLVSVTGFCSIFWVRISTTLCSKMCFMNWQRNLVIGAKIWRIREEKVLLLEYCLALNKT